MKPADVKRFLVGIVTGGLPALSGAGKARAILAALAVLLVAYLLFAGKPWSVSVEAGKTLKTSQYATIYFWYAALINLGLTGLLAATAGWWTRLPGGKRRTLNSPCATPSWFWPLVILAMAMTAWFGWPRLGQSLWHDEAYPVRRTIVGEYREQEDGAFKLKPVSWTDTLFYFKKPNHVLHSAVCRVFNDTWRFFARPKGLQFSETAIRLPTYLAGIASVATLALFLKTLGFPSAGVIAAFLFALHPWQIRYTTEARGYAFIFFLLPLLLYFVLRALDNGRGKWWAGFAIAQFLMMYAYPTCVYVLLILNLCIPLMIWGGSGWSIDSRDQMARWLAANIFAAMAFLQVMLPCIPQFLAYVGETYGLGEVNFQWMQDFLAHLLAGIPWSHTQAFPSLYVEMLPWAVNHPGLMVLIVLLAVGVLAVGIRRLMISGLTPALMVAPLLLPAILCYVEMRVRSGHMYVWYVIFILPGVIALCAIGFEEVITLARSRGGRIAAVAVVASIIGSFAAWTAPQRQFLMAHSMQPNRESVLLTRPSLDPLDPRQQEILTATFFGEPFPYDDRMIVFRTLPNLEKLVRRADAGNKALFINLGYLVTVEGEHRNKYELLKKSGLFEDLGLLQGYEPLQSRHVFKYKPGSAAGFDFSQIPADVGSPGRGED